MLKISQKTPLLNLQMSPQNRYWTRQILILCVKLCMFKYMIGFIVDLLSSRDKVLQSKQFQAWAGHIAHWSSTGLIWVNTRVQHATLQIYIHFHRKKSWHKCSDAKYVLHLKTSESRLSPLHDFSHLKGGFPGACELGICFPGLELPCRRESLVAGHHPTQYRTSLDNVCKLSRAHRRESLNENQEDRG